MQIVICDDEKEICRILAEKISVIMPEAEVLFFYSGDELLNSHTDPDILLLDIRMPELDGMDVAHILRDNGWKKILIFVTGEKDQVFHAFDVQAFHFLVKPIRDEQLKEVLTKAVSALDGGSVGSGREERYISVKTITSHIRINHSDILYAEVFNRKIVIYTPKENIEYYGQLADLEKLAGRDFYRVHRSFLVHLKYVEMYNGKIVKLSNGKEVPMARRSYQGFVRAYMGYCKKLGMV